MICHFHSGRRLGDPSTLRATYTFHLDFLRQSQVPVRLSCISSSTHLVPAPFSLSGWVYIPSSAILSLSKVEVEVRDLPEASEHPPAPSHTWEYLQALCQVVWAEGGLGENTATP